ncbi:aminodeoxychorismate synthase component I [SAR92 clade bacterium H455]|uniref:aminodeoxychorismate synthase n=1 Tax=SAR92 clade bacterium H455 TaxID=2974818 RepID=A0ABY5TKZ1_9GAMM|nr:aminodeoxychorismate synthase component I [SAR92 clade bacterium H455]
MPILNIQEIPYRSSSEILFAAVRDLPDAVWLDSGAPHSIQGRYDIISACPDGIIETHGAISTIVDQHGSRSSEADPFALAEQLLEPLADKTLSTDYPFVGGLIGYFGYDLGRRLIHIPSTAKQITQLPDMRIGRFLWALVVDHQEQRSELVFHPQCADELRQLISSRLSDLKAPESTDKFSLKQKFVATLSEPDYKEAIRAVKSYIESGDCYQTNFTQHYSAHFSGDLWPAYLALREAVGSPYSAFWQWRDQGLLCVSPERFISIVDRQAETKPIKGTIKRGSDPEQDQQRAEQLIASAKDRAENLMIVDLLRNDLSRNSEPGSIRVPKLFELESFANVHHLVSTVTGLLAEDSTPLAMLRDSFPGGSITGAPKKRAMEIIEQLEPVRRSVYCGSIGYISANQNMDSNIAIRTIIADGDTLHCWGGGGIVADSEESQEYQESIDKIKALLEAVERFI